MLRSAFVQVLSKTRRASAAEVLGGPHAGAYRAPAVGVQGAVSAAHGLAATAGLRILMQGGNAVDAVVDAAGGPGPRPEWPACRRGW